MLLPAKWRKKEGHPGDCPAKKKKKRKGKKGERQRRGGLQQVFVIFSNSS